MVSFLAIELILHATEFRKVIPVAMTNPERLRNYYLNTTDELGIDINPAYGTGVAEFAEGQHEVFSNSLGCFDREDPVPNDPILLVGDSFTWGFASFENKWGTELERRMGERVLKCGVSGTGTRYQLLKAKKIVQLTGKTPKFILVGYFLNDFGDDIVFPSDAIVDGRRVSRVKKIHLDTGTVDYFTGDELQRRFANYQKSGGFKDYIRDHSILAILAWQQFKGTKVQEFFEDIQFIHDLKLYQMKNVPWVKQAWERHLKSVTDFKKFAESQGSQLVFILIPDKYGKRADEMARFLKSSGIQYVDLYEEFQKSGERMADLYWTFDDHFSEKGNLLTGKIVSDYLQSITNK